MGQFTVERNACLIAGHSNEHPVARLIDFAFVSPHEQIVDILGRLLWRALVHQFPPEMFDGTLAMGYPSTYIHRTFHGVANMQTVVPVGADGDLDLSFEGMKLQTVPFGPPQSARSSVVSMSPDQYERLGQLRFVKGDHQEMCQRIYQRVKKQDGQVRALVLATDMKVIKNAIERGDMGTWQELFRDIIGKTTET